MIIEADISVSVEGESLQHDTQRLYDVCGVTNTLQSETTFPTYCPQLLFSQPTTSHIQYILQNMWYWLYTYYNITQLRQVQYYRYYFFTSPWPIEYYEQRPLNLWN